MSSWIIPCKVRHERFSPRKHSFSYPLYTYCIDLAELERLGRELHFFGHNTVRPASVHDTDYLAAGAAPIRDKLAALLTGQGIDLAPGDRVLLVTSARFLNYIFNPVSFYWIFRGESLLACVAEVNNTFGEKHVYPLPADRDTAAGDPPFPARFSTPKAFHVSPFYDRKGQYSFSFADIRQRLDVSVRLEREGETTFEASLTEDGERRPLTDAALLRIALTRPLTAHLTFPRILWQAAKIHFGKKIPYHPKPEPMSDMTIRRLEARNKPSRLNALGRRLVTAYLSRMQAGDLTVSPPPGAGHGGGGTALRFGGNAPGASAHIDVHDMSFFRRCAFDGDIGLGETYAEGMWTSPDMLEVFRFFLDNQQRVLGAGSPARAVWRAVSGFAMRRRHMLAPRNTEAGARQNIGAHYDLSNELFAAFLDPTMTYSTGVFQDPCDDREDLEQAQRRKHRILARKAHIGPDSHVLEIGCGWGGFAIQTAQETGCRVTGVTISEQQFELARERVRAAGLEDRVDIRFLDYRRLEERFDAIVSIEMLEAVDHANHPTFFKTLDRLLAPGGVAVIQTITIQDARYQDYRATLDWIRKHIFPGGHLPSLTRICQVAARHTGLTVQNVDALGLHYANTLCQWRRTFLDRWGEIETLGFDDYFRRTWEYYLTICEAGFRAGNINNLQIVLSRAEEPAVAGTCRIWDEPGVE